MWIRIRAVIIEDEPLAAQYLAELLDDTCQVAVVGSAAESEAGLRLCAELRPDAVFVEINLPGTRVLEQVLVEKFEFLACSKKRDCHERRCRADRRPHPYQKGSDLLCWYFGRNVGAQKALRNTDACAKDPSKDYRGESQWALQLLRQECFDHRRPHE